MKRKYSLYIVVAVIVVLLVAGYLSRTWISDWWYDMNRPKLPAAIAYQEEATKPGQVSPATPSPIEGGVSASEHFLLESSPQSATPPVNPLASDVQIPEQLNLAVPWISQAPHGDWGLPYQEACEEASMIMVDGFYKDTKSITPDQADVAIKKVVDYENKTRGDYKDTDAQETAKILQDYFGYKDVRVLSFKTSEDIMKVLAHGYPVIIPFSGKDLKNPNFRNGGPLYHMLVIKGYTSDGLFITSDPGTRKGQDYTYPFQRIIDAAHDWNGGDVANGDKLMIVVLPNK